MMAHLQQLCPNYSSFILYIERNWWHVLHVSDTVYSGDNATFLQAEDEIICRIAMIVVVMLFHCLQSPAHRGNKSIAPAPEAAVFLITALLIADASLLSEITLWCGVMRELRCSVWINRGVVLGLHCDEIAQSLCEKGYRLLCTCAFCNQTARINVGARFLQTRDAFQVSVEFRQNKRKEKTMFFF